jgi:uncharacterized membrane protein
MNEKIEIKIIKIGFVISFLAIWMNLFWDYVNKLGEPSPMLYNIIIGAIMSGFAYMHSKRYFGLLKTNVLFISAAVISLILEHIGVKTGMIYGEYHYGTIIGPKLFGTVPILIPLAWFFFLYPSVIISNEILSGKRSLVAFIKKGGSVFQIVIFAAFDSIIMTALDLLLDPIWTTRGSWFWTGLDKLSPGKILYNIPVQNYFGWLLTTFIIFLVFRTLFFLKKDSFEEKDKLYYLPIYNFAALFIVWTIEAWTIIKNPGVILISIMTLGFISIMALYKNYLFIRGDE